MKGKDQIGWIPVTESGSETESRDAIDSFRDQLESIYAISVEIASLRDLSEIYERALDCCLALTGSQMGFIDLINSDGVDMDVVAVEGFEPAEGFFERFQRMPVRPSVFGVVITEERSHISNDLEHDPFSVGTPPGHPRVKTFLGVPLRVGTKVIGMVGVANHDGGYGPDETRLLSTFANQVAVAIDNARLYEHQRHMIHRLQTLNQRLEVAERDQLLELERRRIAAGLHDRIEQHIFSIGLQLAGLLEGDLPPETSQRLYELRRLAGMTADEVREVIFALSNPTPDDSGLTSSIRRLIRQAQRSGGFEADLVVSGEPPAGIEQVQFTIHEVVREAMNNIVKHAHAREVLVSLRYDEASVDVVLQDDGVGASDLVLRMDSSSQLHYGLKNMRHQIEGLGGTFSAENGEESGFKICFRVPISPDNPPPAEGSVDDPGSAGSEPS